MKKNIVIWETSLSLERQLFGELVDTPSVLRATLGRVFLGEQRSPKNSVDFPKCGCKFKCFKSFKFNNALNVGLAVRDFLIIYQAVTL